jgi:hypothetical protein
MLRNLRIGVFAAVGLAAGAQAAPFVPGSDSQVLERLPFAASDPVIRKLGALRGQLKNQRDNLPLALTLARGYLDRREGAPGVVGVDITKNGIAKNFPFLPTPYDGKNRRHIDCGEPGANPCGPLVP